MHTSLTDQVKFKQSYLYPQTACREALINAIVHRNYAIQGRGIEISIFSDRLEISSPGRLLSTISLEDIKQLKGAHESRNPLIARVLREVGYVREMGEGIRRIFDVMRSNALAEPEIQTGNDTFTVTLFHRSLYDPKVKLWLSLFESFKLSESQTAVIALGYEGHEFSTQDIIDRLGIVDTDQVREILTPLRQLGLVTRTKSHAQAYSLAKDKKLAKRAIPIYKVITNPTIHNESVIDQNSGKNHKNSPLKEITIFIGGLEYTTTKEQIVSALNEHCVVLNVDLPKGTTYGSHNKGFAFATIEIPIIDEGTVVKIMDGLVVNNRKVSINIAR